jgi:hypothetical protein
VTEDELYRARGITPPKIKPKPPKMPRRDLQEILTSVDLGKEDPFGEQGTAIVVLRLAGLNIMQIVNHLQLDEKTGVDHVRQVLFQARKEARLADVPGLLDHRAVPGAVDNLIKGIDDGDKEYTLAVLKGRGAFRNFERSDGDQKLSLEITIDGLEADGRAIPEGTVVGIPRTVALPDVED